MRLWIRGIDSIAMDGGRWFGKGGRVERGLGFSRWFLLCVVAKWRSASLSLGIMISIVVVLVRLLGRVVYIGEGRLYTCS